MNKFNKMIESKHVISANWRQLWTFEFVIMEIFGQGIFDIQLGLIYIMLIGQHCNTDRCHINHYSEYSAKNTRLYIFFVFFSSHFFVAL